MREDNTRFSIHSASAMRSARPCSFEQLEPRLMLSGMHYVVGSRADVVATDGFVTLRKAIEAANTNTAVTADVLAGSDTQADLITFDQAALSDMAGVPVGSPLTVTLDPEQLDALAKEPQVHAMVAVYIYAGLRREELLWLTREDVDLDSGRHGIIHVREKERGGRDWCSKTRINRIVPISRALWKILETYWPWAGGPWLFPSPCGLWWDPDNFSRRLRRLNQSAELPWTCLDFRHTFGSHLAMKGESLYKISKLMGNSPEICRRHYAHLAPESLEACVDFDEPVVNRDSDRAADRPNNGTSPRFRLVI